jgi:hypothetical protein
LYSCHPRALKNENKTDKDLGLAVIERWTHLFLTAYNEKARPETTLHELMVEPFKDKMTLAANIGTKEDTSKRKFKDIRLREFFGIKGGGSAGEKSMTPKPRTTTTFTKSIGDSHDDVNVTEVSDIMSQRAMNQRLPRDLKKANSSLEGRRRTSESDERNDIPVSTCLNSDTGASQNENNATFVCASIALISAVIVGSTLERLFSGSRRTQTD